MRDAVSPVLDRFLADADAALGPDYSAILYGSAARGDFVAGRSDINLLLLLDDADPARLRALTPAFTAWRKAAQEPPLLLSRDEWRHATDAFPIEITDMRLAYRVLRGNDPLADLAVAPADLRRALERELRGKALRLRQAYVAWSGDPAALGGLAQESAATILVLFRALLSLAGRPVPSDASEIAAAAAEVAGLHGDDLAEIVRHRGDRSWRCEPAQFEAYVRVVDDAARYIDQLDTGDHR